MALIKFTIDDTTNPREPKIDPDGVLNLHAGDRLLFTTKSGQDVLVDLGDEIDGTLVALVKKKSPPNFEITSIGGSLRVKLLPPGGNGPDSDPP